MLGVSLFSHVQGVLLIPSYFYLCYLAFRNNVKNRLIFSYFFIPFLFLALLYIYPIINNESLKNVLSSSEKSWVSDSLKKDLVSYSKDLMKALGYIIYNFWFLNFAIFFMCQRLFTILFLNLFFQFFYKFIFDCAVAVNVIRSNTCLPAI